MAQLHDLSALQQASAVREGEVSPVELVEHYLSRIEANADLGAFLTVTADPARKQALQAARTLAEGLSADELPPLFGVPLAIKDLTTTAGVRTTYGSAVFADYLPDYDDDVVTLLRSAGTISLGKTNVPEFGLPCYTRNRLTGPAVTPWDRSRLAGGSSGGAAAAVAAGLLPFAHGTDGGGSVRIPAGVCGLVGLKTSRGRISRGPVGSDPLGLSVHGPLARTTADAAALLDAMAVTVLSEPYFAPNQPTDTFLTAARPTGERLRIARTLSTPVDGVEIDPEVLQAYQETTDLLSDLGHEVVELTLNTPPGLVEAFLTVWAGLAHGTPLPSGAGPLLMPLTAHLLERGSAVSGPQLVAAVGALQTTARSWVRQMLPFDAVLTPTVAQLPRLLDHFTGDEDPAADFARQLLFTPWTAQANITGQPAINVPLCWTEDGLPVGMQFIGRPGDERTLLQLSAELEEAAPWVGRTPDCW